MLRTVFWLEFASESDPLNIADNLFVRDTYVLVMLNDSLISHVYPLREMCYFYNCIPGREMPYINFTPSVCQSLKPHSNVHCHLGGY